MRIQNALVLALLLFVGVISAQSDEHAHHHDHHANEIGVAQSLVRFVKEEEFAYGVHVHYIRNFSHSRFGVGLAYERIFDEHKHNTLGIVGLYRPVEKLSLSISPGLAFEDGNSGVNFALHLETTYELEINNFHIGPLVEFAYDAEDVHISLGIHFGYGF
jgi:hypothetical protein